MNSTLISQHELTVRPFALGRPVHVDVVQVPVAYQASTHPCTTLNFTGIDGTEINSVDTMSTAWRGGTGSKLNTSVCASKRPTTRLLVEVLT